MIQKGRFSSPNERARAPGVLRVNVFLGAAACALMQGARAPS